MDRFSTIIANLYQQYQIPRVFPVPLINIAKALGYTVFNLTITDQTKYISGAVLYDQRQILLNPTETEARRNFTLAHEIGHIILGGPQQAGRIIDTRNDILRPSMNTREWDANEFAAELLMPAPKVIQLWQQTHSIVALADFFNTSTSATIVRLERVGML